MRVNKYHFVARVLSHTPRERHTNGQCRQAESLNLMRSVTSARPPSRAVLSAARSRHVYVRARVPLIVDKSRHTQSANAISSIIVPAQKFMFARHRQNVTERFVCFRACVCVCVTWRRDADWSSFGTVIMFVMYPLDCVQDSLLIL